MMGIDCEFRKMFGYPAYFKNGNMFAGLVGDMLFLRLSESDREEIMRLQPAIRPLEPRPGKVMKEYVVLPEDLYRDEKLFDAWLKRSYDYASSLPAKKKGTKK